MDAGKYGRRHKYIFQICVMAVLVAVQPGRELDGVSARVWLVWGLAVLTGLSCVSRGKGSRSRTGKRRKWTVLDSLLGVFLLWNVFQIMADAVAMEGYEEGNLLSIALVVLFFLAPAGDGHWRACMDALLVCAVPVYAGLLWHFLGDAGFTYGLSLLLGEERALVPFLLLVGTAAAEGYCGEGDGAGRWFCLGLALAGYFLLFVDGDVMGILLGGAFPFISILAHEPGRERVRRTMQLAFSYFFMMSNMSLVTGYTSLVKVETAYGLEDGVYLELAMALAGVVFFSWWDRLPGDGEEPLYGFQEAVKWILAGAAAVLFALLALGTHLDGMENGAGVALLARFSGKLRVHCASHGGTFMDALAHYGIIGGLWLLCVAFLAARRMGRQLRQGRAEPCQGVVFILYLTGSVFFSQQSATTPIYVLLMAVALFS